MATIVYNERAFAEKMHNTQNFIESFSKFELAIYGKLLKWKYLQSNDKDYTDLSEEENESLQRFFESELIDFSERNYLDFNYNNHWKIIDAALKDINEWRLLVPKRVPITKKEYSTLENIDNVRYRKILFAMLCEAKFFYYNNCSIVRKEKPEGYQPKYLATRTGEVKPFARMMKVTKLTIDEIKNFSHTFYQSGLLGLFREIEEDRYNPYRKKKYRTNWKVQFADVDDDPDNIVGWITDMNHLDLHYESLFEHNARIGCCEVCGALFRRRTNNQKYCKEHQGYNQKSVVKKCIDCGKEFYVNNEYGKNRNRRQVRCECCQKEKRREDNRIAAQKHREKLKIQPA